ncbi:hypothetical protein BB561_003757 [Smittium simulii]|uniref:Casein kinase II subunit beta n=1 Tax=Smittium simulii TaxID=133385 RepID=A0A2T9YJM8_9FUNG|nr:hypothetical protein BB561_003757 [Smittium simulii]
MSNFYEKKPDYELSTDSSEDEEALPWITWFCTLLGHDFFCEVQEEFIDDEFNLTGLSQMVNYFTEALDIILDIDTEGSQEDKLEGDEAAMVEMSAEILYGLIHARYILTRDGLERMALKYENADFGYCPRYYCQMTRVLPCGVSDVPEIDTVRLYCPNCNDMYSCSSSRFNNIDGAFFGTTFAHLFFETFPDFLPKNSRTSAISTLGPNPIYIPKIFGFKVSEFSKTSSRMKWLRMRPQDSDSEMESDSIPASAPKNLPLPPDLNATVD